MYLDISKVFNIDLGILSLNFYLFVSEAYSQQPGGSLTLKL